MNKVLLSLPRRSQFHLIWISHPSRFDQKGKARKERQGSCKAKATYEPVLSYGGPKRKDCSGARLKRRGSKNLSWTRLRLGRRGAKLIPYQRMIEIHIQINATKRLASLSRHNGWSSFNWKGCHLSLKTSLSPLVALLLYRVVGLLSYERNS